MRFYKGVVCCTIVSQPEDSKRVCNVKNVFPTQDFPTRQAVISFLTNTTKPACTHKKAIRVLNYT